MLSLLVLIFTLFLISPGYSADFVNQSVQEPDKSGYVWVVTFNDDGGDNITKVAMDNKIYQKVAGGFLYQVTTIPGSTGPTNAAWEPVVTMGSGAVNLFGTAADNRSSTAEQTVLIDDYFAISDLLYFATTGNSQAGGSAVVRIYIYKEH